VLDALRSTHDRRQTDRQTQTNTFIHTNTHPEAILSAGGTRIPSCRVVLQKHYIRVQTRARVLVQTFSDDRDVTQGDAESDRGTITPRKNARQTLHKQTHIGHRREFAETYRVAKSQDSHVGADLAGGGRKN